MRVLTYCLIKGEKRRQKLLDTGMPPGYETRIGAYAETCQRGDTYPHKVENTG